MKIVIMSEDAYSSITKANVKGLEIIEKNRKSLKLGILFLLSKVVMLMRKEHEKIYIMLEKK